ncbi:MAG: hypothetical protein AAFP78_12895 [Pseudomonadota bacterium]
MRLGHIALAIAVTGGNAAAETYRSKPGAPRPPAQLVGATEGIAPPEAPTEEPIGAVAGGAAPPSGLRSATGGGDYGFDPIRETAGERTPPLGGAPRLPWPNK